MTDRRFIEVDFPIRAVSEHSAREKNTRRGHGHISTLHIWWARRPLAASRASIYAALIPQPKDEEEQLKKFQFIARLGQMQDWNGFYRPFEEFVEQDRLGLRFSWKGVASGGRRV